MARYAACMLRVQNDSLFHYRGLRYCIGVPTNCFLPYSFRAADIINTDPPMGNSSVRSHELSASAPQESKWDVSLIDPRENNIRREYSFVLFLYNQTANFLCICLRIRKHEWRVKIFKIIFNYIYQKYLNSNYKMDEIYTKCSK